MNPLKIMSVSAGSSSRNKTVLVELDGSMVEISRTGTNGDLKKMAETFKAFDGKVAAFGLGGADFYVEAAGKKYYLRSVNKFKKYVQKSKFADGSGIKAILEKNLVKELCEQKVIVPGKKALVSSGVERYNLAEYLRNSGCSVYYGDLLYYFNIPIIFQSKKFLHFIAKTLLPVLRQLPYQWFYPTGEKQNKPSSNRFDYLFNDIDILAGDFLQIHQYLPTNLSNKLIITNTTTEENLQLLKERDLHCLATSTPRYDGRSFGTNVIEALILALIDKPQNEINQEDISERIERTKIKGSILMMKE